MNLETGLLSIDLAAVAANYRKLAGIAAGEQTAAAVKADAYGLGIVKIAPVLARAGCDFFYVANMAEGLALRAILPDAKIAALHGIDPTDHELALRHRLIPVLGNRAALEGWRAAARAMAREIPVIIYLDTGMNRLGLAPKDVDALLADPDGFKGLKIEYWLSHLACADEPAHPMNKAQLSALSQYMIRLPVAPFSFANSSGIFLGSPWHFDQVRPGMAIYGLNPVPGKPNPMQPVVRLEAPVLQIRDIEPDATVGYGASWRSKRLGKAAILPVGYADGFLRSLSNRGHVAFGDHLAPVAGRVSMDLLTVDVTDVPEALCRPGMLATLIGPGRDADAVATEAGTLGYEILTGLGARYKRAYTGA